MRIPPPRTWQENKEEGRAHYNAEAFDLALNSYRAALTGSAPPRERQIILSNIVACRLKIGGSAQNSAALADAKQCVAINNRWPKGHIRLASCHIALNKSNDACNALQRALTLDPSNQVARNMLTAELRRDRVRSQEYSTSDDVSDRPYPSAPQQPDEFGVDMNERGNWGGVNWGEWRHQIGYRWEKCLAWYYDLNSDAKSLLRLLGLLVVLYVMLGGRFGLDSGRRGRKLGNYGRGNVYHHYNNRGNGQSYGGAYDYGGSSDSRYGSAYDFSYHDSYQRPRRNQSSSSMHFPNLFDGSLPSMMCLFGILFLAQKFLGVNPFHALMIARGMGLGGFRRGMGLGGFGRGMGLGGFGRGMGGFRRGMGGFGGGWGGFGMGHNRRRWGGYAGGY